MTGQRAVSGSEGTSPSRRRWPSARTRWGPWLLTFVAAALAVVGIGAIAGLPPTHRPPVMLSWWMLAPAFYLAERAVVRVKFYQRPHSFMLTEIPLVVGLFVTAPADLVAAQIAGMVAALAVHRRLARSMAFDVAQAALRVVVASALFRVLSDTFDPLGPGAAAAAVLAVVVATLFVRVLSGATLRLAGERLESSEVPRVVLAAIGTALMNGALALGIVHLLWLRPASAPIAMLPPVVLYLAYRAYAGQTQERAQLAEMYDTTRQLQETPDIETALEAITRRARAVFDADVAQVVLVTDLDGAFLTGIGPADRSYTMERIDRQAVPGVAELAVARSKGIVDETWSGAAMAAPLYERDRVIGALLVAEPIGPAARFGTGELKLLQTLASQVSVSLENGRLEDSLDQVTRLKEELHHQALHDGLTGLANRRLLFARIGETLTAAERSGGTALVFLDIDDFKVVNDRLGHHGGDELLQIVAGRLVAASRPGDTVARLGGDEFAVLLMGLNGIEEAEMVARRILDSLATPYRLGSDLVTATASVGVAHLEPGIDPGELLRRADQAMYAAKGHQKGTYRMFASQSRPTPDIPARLSGSRTSPTG